MNRVSYRWSFGGWVAGAAAAVAASPAVSVAQGEPIEEIVVQGFRGSLGASLNAKRNADGAVDVIVAEDIADFPDLNLAESLQRIPGVAITRAGGEGRQVSVRGLGPTYTTTRINGMEALSTGGFTDALGGANRTRGFDFNAFDSELFSRLAIHKTSSAEVEEGGLGATLDQSSLGARVAVGGDSAPLWRLVLVGVVLVLLAVGLVSLLRSPTPTTVAPIPA